MENQAWKAAEAALAEAEEQLALKKFREARKSAFLAGKSVMEAYAEGKGGERALSLAEWAKALELPFEVFAVCDKLDLENPDAPKKMLPVKPEGETADERVHQARSLVRFLKWAHSEPPGTQA